MTRFKVGVFGTILAAFLTFAVRGNALAASADVTIENYDFHDAATGTSSSSINVGDTVTWHWAASNHSTTSGSCAGAGGPYGGTCNADGLWDSNPAISGSVFSHTFSTAGTFNYFCKIHQAMMTGRVVVHTVAPPPPPPPPPPAPVTCTPDAETLCIDDITGDKRFKVQVHFETAQGGGQSGDGQAIPLSSLGVTEGGLFWFFSANNPELLIKIVNGCAVNQHWWVFASAGTNVGATITITDTSDQSVKVYTNPDLTPMAAIQDTSAFSNCQ